MLSSIPDKVLEAVLNGDQELRERVGGGKVGFTSM